MSYVSMIYLILFLPVTVAVYQWTKQPYRWIVLLAASILFYWTFSLLMFAYVVVTVGFVYWIGLKVEAITNQLNQHTELGISKEGVAVLKKKSRCWIILAAAGCLGILVVLKYSYFIARMFGVIFSFSMASSGFLILKFMVPLGISFYTLQAISYLIDITRSKTAAQHNIAKLGLYLIFFPSIMEGPIHRYQEMSGQLYAGTPVSWSTIEFGGYRILWGLFKKLLIADRLNSFVSAVFDRPLFEPGGALVLVGAFAYTLQLYMDFSGVVDICIGTGEIFSIKMPENFRQPFFSRTAAEFWKRWHITLGTWFKDYLFYPILLSKPVKTLNKKLKLKHSRFIAAVVTNGIALFAVWICNGLWHGAGLNYAFFGMYYFVILELGIISEPLMKRLKQFLHLDPDGILVRGLQAVKVFFIVIIGEMFFRVSALSISLKMFASIFTHFKGSVLTDGTLLQLTLDIKDYWVVAIALVVVVLVSVLKEKKVNLRQKLMNSPVHTRWVISYALILIILVFGAYGPGYTPADIIYAKF